MNSAIKKVGVFVPVTLGMLTAFGPFVTDFYLPSVPEMTGYFLASPSAVAASLTAGMIGLAAGQILIGPLSDKCGRKFLLVLSMLLFAVSSFLCLLAPDINTFNLLRILQGMAGAGGVVLSKSMATDMFTGKPLSDFMALLGAINGIAPIFAPVLGGGLSMFFSWKGVFCVLLAIGVILMCCSMRLKETLPREKRNDGSLLVVYSKLFRVFCNKRFTMSTLSMMMTFITFFAYISASPFIFQKIYGLTPFEFSLCFGLNAFTIGIGTLLSTRFHHSNTALKWGSIDFMVSALLVAACQVFSAPLAVLMPCYIYLLMSFGLMQPVSMSIAMDSERSNAGAASAIYGAASFVAGSIASPLVTMGNIMTSSAVVIVIGALLCLAITLPLCSEIKREAMNKAR